MRKFLIFLIILAILGGGAVFLNWQSNLYSKEALKLEIFGPSQAALAQEVEYTVKYKNNGNFRLEEPELIFVPPENSISEGKLFERQVWGKDKLGEAIYPGEEKSITFKMRLLGKEEDVKIAKASLSYRPKNLKARYESSTSFTTSIKSVPVTLEFDLPSKIASEKDFLLKINYFSNIDYVFTNLRLKIEYPFGFEFVSSLPKSIEKVEWEIPVLNKSEGGRIEITGRISGEVGEARVFKAGLGIWQDGEFVLLKETMKGVEVIKPSLYLRQEINKNPSYVAMPGDWLHYEIYFKNIGEDDLTNLFMVNKLEGEAFDFEMIKSDLGIYQSGDNSVVFDWRNIPKLQLLSPTEEEKVDFWIRVRDNLGNVKNPVLRNKVFVGQAKEEFVTKISSKLEIVQKGYFQDEVFGNSGHLPPTVGETTTYTIMWQAKNYYSDVKDVKVKALLPPNVELSGRIFPEEASSKFSFDSKSREIVWSVGDLERGTGVLKAGPSIAFQVVLTPTEFQRGMAANIIGEARIEGLDVWTETNLQARAPGVTTGLLDDPTITQAMKFVE